MKLKVIKRKNLPVQLPVVGTIVWYLFLDNLRAPEWVWGVVFTVLSVFWVLVLCLLFVEDDVDIFKDE